MRHDVLVEMMMSLKSILVAAWLSEITAGTHVHTQPILTGSCVALLLSGALPYGLCFRFARGRWSRIYGIHSYSTVVGYAEGYDSVMVRFLAQLVALWHCS